MAAAAAAVAETVMAGSTKTIIKLYQHLLNMHSHSHNTHGPIVEKEQTRTRNGEIAENHSMEKIAWRKENFTFCVIKCEFRRR